MFWKVGRHLKSLGTTVLDIFEMHAFWKEAVFQDRIICDVTARSVTARVFVIKSYAIEVTVKER